jgi:hypothetical protein
MDRQGGVAMTRRAAGVLSGTDAWSREARRVRAMATRLGLALDEEDLALQDVRDLQALHASLHGRWAGHTRTRCTALLGLRARVRMWATEAVAPLTRRA